METIEINCRGEGHRSFNFGSSSNSINVYSLESTRFGIFSLLNSFVAPVIVAIYRRYDCGFSIKILYQQEDKKNANDPQINKMTQLMAKRCARKIVNQKASFPFTWGFSSSFSIAIWLPLMNVERIHFWSELLFFSFRRIFQ